REMRDTSEWSCPEQMDVAADKNQPAPRGQYASIRVRRYTTWRRTQPAPGQHQSVDRRVESSPRKACPTHCESLQFLPRLPGQELLEAKGLLPSPWRQRKNNIFS